MPNPVITAKQVFDHAHEIKSLTERKAYLDQVCAGSPELRQEVEGLLRSYEEMDSDFLSGPNRSLAINPDLTGAYIPANETPDHPADTPRNDGPSRLSSHKEHDNWVGKQIGPYRLLEKLGEGGFGLVYRAQQDKPIRRQVALKLIVPGQDSAQVLARFDTERQALTRMDHENIAKVLDAGTTEAGQPYYVMECIDGKSLTDYCREKTLTIRKRLEIFATICQAVQHAHQRGIIHRDLKPVNILVAMKDDKPIAKIIDFGLAKATVEQLTEHSELTQAGDILGTWRYMSPEQAEGGIHGIDTRTDIYSLGVILYELLTGTAVIAGTKKSLGAAEFLRQLKDEHRQRPSDRVLEPGNRLPVIAAERKIEPGQLARLGVSGSAHTISFSYGGDANFIAITASSTIAVTPASSSFASLSSPTIVYGTATTTVSGTLDNSSNLQLVPAGELVHVTLNGVTQNGTLSSNDSFSATFNTSSLGASGSAYTIGFSYSGDANFSGAATSSTLTVTPASPSFANLSSPTITYGTGMTTISGTFAGNAGSQLVPAGEVVQVTLNGITQNATLTNSNTFSTPFNTSQLGVSVSAYTIGFNYGGDANFNETAASGTLAVTPASPSFAGLSSPTIVYGTAATIVSGTLDGNAGFQLVPMGEAVQVTINGVSQNGILNSNDSFSATFNTGALGVSGSTYAIHFNYGGDANFTGANESSTLTVNRATTSFANLGSEAVVGNSGLTTISGTLNANANGQKVPAGETVQVTLNGISQNAALDSNDNFSTTFNISTLQAASSPYAIEFNYGGDSDFIATTGSGSFSITPGSVYPANSLVTVLAPAIQLGGKTTVTLQARDPAGIDELTGGLKVTFALGSKTGAKGSFTAVKDNHNGTYTSTFTGTLDGNNTIIATINGLQVPATAPISVEGAAFSTSESLVTVSSTPIVAGTTTMVTLQAEYPKNNDEPAGGLSVVFKLGSTKGGQGTFSAVTDHGNGLYTAIFTGTLAGNNTIKAVIDGKAVTSTPPSIQVVTGPLDLANSPVTLSATSMDAGGTETITFQPQDAGGNKLMLGGTILPVFSLGSGTGTFGSVIFNSKTGRYTVTLTTTTSGSYTIETSYNNQSVTSKAPTVTVTPGPTSTANSSVTVSEPSVSVGTKVTVTLKVVDLYGNAVAQSLVIAFALGSGSGKGTFGKVTDLGNGLYQASFTPTTAGKDTIEVKIGGVKVKSTASLTVTAG